jgi:3D (Asp-Asp-Asp) domain-containing protein
MSIRTVAVTLICAVLLSSRTSAATNALAKGTRATMRVAATAYCDKGRTRSGVRTHSGIVAADPRVLPLGTVLMILDHAMPYAGPYTVMDTGGGVKGREIDIFIPNCASAARFGRRQVRLRIIRRGPNPRARADDAR